MANMKECDLEKHIQEIRTQTECACSSIKRTAAELEENIKTAHNASKELPRNSIDLVNSATIALVKDITVETGFNNVKFHGVTVSLGNYGYRIDMQENPSEFKDIDSGKYRMMFFMVPLK